MEGGRGWPSRVALRFICASASKTSKLSVVVAQEGGDPVQHLRPGCLSDERRGTVQPPRAAVRAQE